MQLKINFTRFLRSLFTALFISFIAFSVIAQEQEEAAPETSGIIQEAIAINEISIESEKLGQRIFKLRSILEPSLKTLEIDSLLNITSVEINLKRDTLLSKINIMSQRRLDVQEVEWENYKSDLKGFQDILIGRLDEVTKTNDELVDEIKKWELTKKTLEADKEKAEVSSSLDKVIATLREVTDISHSRLDSIFIIQKSLTGLILTVDEVLSEIKRMQMELQKNYFIFDSPSLFKYSEIKRIAADTTSAFAKGEQFTLKSGVSENLTQLKDFLKQNIKTVIFEVIFLLLILGLMFIVRKKWEKDINDLSNPVEKEAKIVLQHPFSSTLVVGLLVAISFYSTLVPIFSEIHILFILSATAFLLPILTTKRFNIFLLLLLVVYIFQTLEVYFNPQSFSIRLLLLFDAMLLIAAFIFGRFEMRKNPDRFSRIKGLFKFVTPIYMMLLFVAIIANFIGMVNLSRFLITAIVSSTALGIVVFLSIKVFTSIFILFVKWRNSANIKAFSTMVSVTQKRLKPILLFVGLIVWLLFTLMSFEVYDYLLIWIEELLLINWQLGKMKISLGDILSFTGIFLVAMLIAKLAAAIFQDEWLIKVLPRGIAPAISLLLRIIIITIGLYAGFFAAGLDLSQLGFMFGALGVGIGFGLQSVVLNFIAGLILAFERPINLGDTIEIDQEMGVVTNVGVRSSNIKTYSGSEAIIPNGDLISKKVINWTLNNRDRRSRVLMKTAANADPNQVIELFNSIASKQPSVYKNPAPWTLFYGYNEEGNLDFALHYWTSFNDTLNTDHDIALEIFTTLREKGIQAPLPIRRIVSEDQN